MQGEFLKYFRCIDSYPRFELGGSLSEQTGYFSWDKSLVCYGKCVSDNVAQRIDDRMPVVCSEVHESDRAVYLPFDSDEVVRNLQYERYVGCIRNTGMQHKAIRNIYYAIRPVLPVSVRKHMQRISLRDWDKIQFPSWPVDITVENLHKRMMAMVMRANGHSVVPFIWFWPGEYKAAVIVTHDVETSAGRDFTWKLMDMDASRGFNASFQVVPEERYAVTRKYLNQIVDRGFEVNIHDLNHDGHLYVEHAEFLRRAKKINQYSKEYGAVGFRSGVMYRNPDWYNAYEFDYDMSTPNVAHLDPQHGGCCTVMPYFIGDLVELPLTCTQDYTLFHMLRDYTTRLWEQQINTIINNNGLITILTHPDYLMKPHEQISYLRLLDYTAQQRDTKHLWATLPREVAAWWRQRSNMKLVDEGGTLRVEGPGSNRARIAYAVLNGETVNYTFNP